MAIHDQDSGAPRRGWADKRGAILSAAVCVFGRDGYSRASIDVIAAEAEVSTRTIYNHFEGKENLFRNVIEYSSAQVAEIQIGLIAHHLDNVTDLDTDLIAFGTAWATPNPQFADHFALVRQIEAERAHIPRSTIETWQNTGPLRVRGEIARRLLHLTDRGLLTAADPDQAATHLVLLTATEVANRANYRLIPLPPAEVTRIVTAGIQTFLRGYGENTGTDVKDATSVGIDLPD